MELYRDTQGYYLGRVKNQGLGEAGFVINKGMRWSLVL